jgi:hypothetical protein
MLTLVSVMGVLIVVGVATLAIAIVRRLADPVSTASLVLDEPPGTRISGVSAAGDRLAVLLLGGGPDRVLLLDARSGRVVGRVGLAR